jgi:hypothetical protein
LWRNDSRPFAMTWITVCIHEKIQQEITPFAMFVSRDTSDRTREPQQHRADTIVCVTTATSGT